MHILLGSHFSSFSISQKYTVSQSKDKKCGPRWPCISFCTAEAFYKARNSYYDMDQTIKNPNPCEEVFREFLCRKSMHMTLDPEEDKPLLLFACMQYKEINFQKGVLSTASTGGLFHTSF